jgi:hypothetical protein
LPCRAIGLIRFLASGVVAAHAVGAVIDPPSLIDIKTGATMMRYAVGTTTRERLRPQRVLGDGETTYHQAIRGSACGLAEGCGYGMTKLCAIAFLPRGLRS